MSDMPNPTPEPEPTPSPEPSPAVSAVAEPLALLPEQIEQVNAARRRVAEARREVLVTKGRLDDARANHKSAVARFEEESFDLERLLDDLLDPPREPFALIAQSPDRPQKPVTRPWDDDEWRGDDLKEALPELSGYILGILAESEIATMGQLADWCKTKRLNQIAGIGDASAEKIEDACAAYWQRKQAERAEQEPADEPGIPDGVFPHPDDEDEDDGIEFDGDEEDDEDEDAA